jgi:hypothetical protein
VVDVQLCFPMCLDERCHGNAASPCHLIVGCHFVSILSFHYLPLVPVPLKQMFENEFIGIKFVCKLSQLHKSFEGIS